MDLYFYYYQFTRKGFLHLIMLLHYVKVGIAIEEKYHYNFFPDVDI